MDPRHLRFDERLKGFCVYCGSSPSTRDHVPSRVLLDEPYPPQLPVVSACRQCNQSFSSDEEYLACLIEVVVRGSLEPAALGRPRVRRTLAHSWKLRKRIRESQEPTTPPRWLPETDRVSNVVLKLARGHCAHELQPQLEDPTHLVFSPLLSLTAQARKDFEQAALSGQIGGWPELGSRSFLRALGEPVDSFEEIDGWTVVQPGRYRYVVSEDGGVLVRMVLSEYLACEAYW